MHALMCLYLYCVALPAAAATQNFWNEYEFCQNLNAKYDSGAYKIVSTCSYPIINIFFFDHLLRLYDGVKMV